MEMRKLGNRMAKRIIHLPQRTISAMNMGNNSTRQIPRRRCRKCFDTIANDQHNFALQRRESFIQSGDSVAGRTC